MKNPCRVLPSPMAGLQTTDIWARRVDVWSHRRMASIYRKEHLILDFALDSLKDYRLIHLKSGEPDFLFVSDTHVTTAKIKKEIRNNGYAWFIRNTKLGTVHMRKDIPTITVTTLVAGDTQRIVLNPSLGWGCGSERIVLLNV